MGRWGVYTLERSLLALWEKGDDMPCQGKPSPGLDISWEGNEQWYHYWWVVHSKHMYCPWLEGLLQIISVIICFGNVYGETNFHCLCFYKFLPYCNFHFLSSSEAVLLELGEFWMVGCWSHISLTQAYSEFPAQTIWIKFRLGNIKVPKHL